MRYIENSIYTGPESGEIFNEIDRNLISYLLSDYIFVSYHDLEKNIFTYRDISNPGNEKTKEILDEKKDIFGCFKEIVEAHIHIDDRATVLNITNPARHASLLKECKSITYYFRWIINDKEYQYYKLVLSKLEAENEEPKHVIMGAACVDEEIREKLKREKEKERMSSLLDGFLREYSTVWLVKTDRTVDLIRAVDEKHLNEAGKALKGLSDFDSGMQAYADMFVAPEDVDRFVDALRYDTLLEKVPEVGIYTVTFRRICEHGQLLYLQVCVSKAVGSDGEVNYVYAVREVDDLIREEMKRREEYQKAIKERDIDVLTGIRNRYSYEKRIKTYAKSEHQTIGCIYIDVDGLHELNNEKGHTEGDTLIKCIGMNVLKYWGRDDTFRIGGDEFVAFCFDIDENELFVTVEQFRERINKAGYSASIGWAVRDIKKLKINELLRTAEDAMFEEKKNHYSGDNDRRRR